MTANLKNVSCIFCSWSFVEIALLFGSSKYNFINPQKNSDSGFKKGQNKHKSLKQKKTKIIRLLLLLLKLKLLIAVTIVKSD